MFSDLSAIIVGTLIGSFLGHFIVDRIMNRK